MWNLTSRHAFFMDADTHLGCDIRCVLNAVNPKLLSLSVFDGRIPQNCAISERKDVK